MSIRKSSASCCATATRCREREVLALMAEGRSNAAIARQLVVSEAAVGKHVGDILFKLRLPQTDDTSRRVLAVLTYLRNDGLGSRQKAVLGGWLFVSVEAALGAVSRPRAAERRRIRHAEARPGSEAEEKHVG